MGGTAFFIYGHLKEENFEPGPIKRSFFQRLFGKEKSKGIETLDLGGGKQIMALDSRGLKPLKKDFINFIKEEIKSPWEASRAVLIYLKLNVMSVDVRGEKENLIFFPLTQFGYALYHGQTRDVPQADDFEGPKYFELDGR